MFKLPDFFDQLDSHQQQMLLVHLAMAEDIVSVAYGNMGDYFRESAVRNPGFYAEGLAWAMRSMALSAVDQLESAVYSRHLDGAQEPERTWQQGYHQGLNSGRLQAAYDIIRHGYQALRSHGMRPKKRSDFWDQASPQVLKLYWHDPDPLVPDDE